MPNDAASGPALRLAQTLIRCRSVTPDDGGCQAILAARLQALGFAIEPMRFGAVDNLRARRGGTTPVVCFAGHTDVVPPGPLEKWQSDPFEPVERAGYLYGRGTADMKSFIAAFVTAVERLVGRTPDHPGSIALLITSDEEGVAVDGTVRVVEALRARDERVDYCIVGEPTSTRTARRHHQERAARFALGRSTRARGPGSRRLPSTSRAIQCTWRRPRWAELAAIQWDTGDEYFPPTTFQISNLQAGTGVTNVIPGELRALFNFRFSTASTVEGLKARVHEILDRHGLDYALEWSVSGMPFLTPRGRLVDAMSQAIRDEIGIEPQLSTSGGTSDGRFIAADLPPGGGARPRERYHPPGQRVHCAGRRGRSCAGLLPHAGRPAAWTLKQRAACAAFAICCATQ